MMVFYSILSAQRVKYCCSNYFENMIFFPIFFQMEGEMQLCLYEALAHVCNALALSLDTHALSVVKQTVNPGGGAKDERILDTVVSNLLNNINSLLRAHTLARSRKAFLLQQKVNTMIRSNMYFLFPSLSCISYHKRSIKAFKLVVFVSQFYLVLM